MRTRLELGSEQRWVVKIGSSLVTKPGHGLERARIAAWTEQIAALRAQGKEILLVSSGAVAEGQARLGLDNLEALHDFQAAAAAGQMGLVQAYETELAKHNLHSAQVLLTHDNLTTRKSYLNARNTLRVLLQLGTVPVINENDTVSVRELQFGDNDRLAAMVANMTDAGLLVILTNQRGLHASDPTVNPDSEVIAQAAVDDPQLDTYAGTGVSKLGRGGMRTKVEAARIAARSGACTWIAGGDTPDILLRLAEGAEDGTILTTDTTAVSARRQWIATAHVLGRITIDDGAVAALRAGRSLLPVGVTAVSGSFEPGDVVGVYSCDNEELARGIVNYRAADVETIKGMRSDQLNAALGSICEPELIHRDNLCTMAPGSA